MSKKHSKNVQIRVESEFLDFQPYVRGIPLRSNGDLVKIALMEVGYKSKSKRSQLRWKKIELDKKHTSKYGFDIEIFRGVVHYSPGQCQDLDIKGYELEFLMAYSDITHDMVARLNLVDKKYLMGYINDDHPKKNLVREILYNNDSCSLDEILKAPHTEGFDFFKGRIAELMVFKEIKNKIPIGVNFFYNKGFFYEDGSVRRSTEVDGVFTYYKTEIFGDLLRKLSNVPHLRVDVNGRLKDYY